LYLQRSGQEFGINCMTEAHLRHVFASTLPTGKFLAARGFMYTKGFPYQRRDVFEVAGAGCMRNR